MNQAGLADMAVEQLVNSFAAIAEQQDRADQDGDQRKVNALFQQLEAVEAELHRRGKDMRGALLTLYDHPNLHVRLKAALATVAVAPLAARQALETISASRRFPQAGEAGMSLWALDEGIFKPT